VSTDPVRPYPQNPTAKTPSPGRDIHKIADAFNKRLETPKYSRTVSVDEIEKNDFNLNIPRYIDSQEAEDIQEVWGGHPL
jgi:type I restriction-modification system DNA methylase subunit